MSFSATVGVVESQLKGSLHYVTAMSGMLMELRYSETSPVFCAQYPRKDSHRRLGSGVLRGRDSGGHLKRNWVEPGTDNTREHTALATA